MKILAGLLVLTRAQDMPGGPGAGAIQDLMHTTDALADDAIDFANEAFGNIDLDMYIIDEDGKARPNSNWKPAGGWKPSNNRPSNNRPSSSNKRPTQRPSQRPTNQRPTNQGRPTGQNRQPVDNSNKNNGNKNNGGGSWMNQSLVNYNNNNNNNYQKPAYQKPTTKPYTTTTKYKDVNECYKGTDDCHYNARCINTIGGYKCICHDGYEGDGKYCNQKDTDECATGSHNCDKYATCKNTYGSYSCSCNSGYNGDGYSCKQDNPDECYNGTHNCSPYAECKDTRWGFKCKCNKGYSGDGVNCQADYVAPVDPCAAANCSPYASCVTGSYGGATCQCQSGYMGSGSGNNGCYDADECYDGTHKCAGNASCMNTVGGYQCACSSGYSGDGYTCNYDDINECANGTHNCDAYAICSNTQTGFDCTCMSGFVGDGISCSKPYVAPAPEPVYEPPSSGYAYGASAPAPEPAYVAPVPAYTPPAAPAAPAYTAPEPAYVAPAPAYTPPAYTAPEPAPAAPSSSYSAGGGAYAAQNSDGTYVTDDSYVGYMEDNSDAYNVVAEAYAENVAAYTPPAAPAYTPPAAPAYTPPAAPAYSGPSYDSAADLYGSSGTSTSQMACSDGITFCSAGAQCVDSGSGVQCQCGAGYTGSGRLSEEDLQVKFEQEKARPPPGMFPSGNTGSNKRPNRPQKGGNKNNNKNGNKNSNKNNGASAWSPGITSTGSGASSWSPGATSTGTSTGTGASSWSPDSTSTTTGGSTITLSDAYGPNTSGYTGYGCNDINECAACGANSYAAGCPCSGPTPICMNIPGGYTCGAGTAYGDPHFRVTSPGQDPVCFDVNAKSGTVLDLFSDDYSSLEINALFKNVHGDKKQFIKAIGFTSPKGIQLAVTPFNVEIYEDGLLKHIYEIDQPINEVIHDTKIVMTPADLTHHHNKHIVLVTCREGEQFKFGVKPAGGSLSVDVEKLSEDVQQPSGLIGQFLYGTSYSIDEEHNIMTENIIIPAEDRVWHEGYQCHKIKEEDLESFLGHNITDYVGADLFSQLFKHGRPAVIEAKLIEEIEPRK